MVLNEKFRSCFVRTENKWVILLETKIAVLIKEMHCKGFPLSRLDFIFDLGTVLRNTITWISQTVLSIKKCLTVLSNFSIDTEMHAMNKVAFVLHDGTIFYSPKVRIRTHCALDMTMFPYDKQMCTIKLGSYMYDDQSLNLTLQSKVRANMLLKPISRAYALDVWDTLQRIYKIISFRWRTLLWFTLKYFTLSC